jgi:hypothetical protein
MMKVRYHLQRGDHYMHWQFKDTFSQTVSYHDPKESIIKLHSCVLHNNRNLANKIYLGKNKDVCAWIKCRGMSIEITLDSIPSWCTKLHYNPKIVPYWHTHDGRNIDELAFDLLYLTKDGVFYDQCREKILNPLKNPS